MCPRPLLPLLLIVAAVASTSLAIAAAPANTPVLIVPAEAAPLHVAVELPKAFPADTSGLWGLIEQGDSKTMLPVDFVPALRPDGTPEQDRVRLVATIPPRKGADKTRRFELIKKQVPIEAPVAAFEWKEISPASLQLTQSKRPVFVYNHGMVTDESVPKKDGRGTRGCYLHPIYGLAGEVLTDDFPRDHYHHHGLFWAWPHVEIDGKEYDLWMGRDIELRFVRWLDRRAGQQSGTIGVENGWFVGDRKVMTERAWITTHRAAGKTQAIDLSLTFIPVDRPITLRGAEGKSYGGATIRFDIPRGRQATITVPRGVTKRDLSMTRLPWADLTYPFAEDGTPSGATLMVSKTHPDYPPSWLTRHYGPLCIGYPGVDPKTFEPGVPFNLSYRLWVHDGAAEVKGLKEAYKAYTDGEQVHWEDSDKN